MNVQVVPPEYRSKPTRWTAIVTGWYLIIILLLGGMTLIYACVGLVNNLTAVQAFSAIAALGFFAFFLVALYFAEGSEIAATTVLERDEDELDLGNAANALPELRRHADEFISGRQLIVVVLVIVFAAYCEQLSNNAQQPSGTPAVLSWVFLDPVKHAYGYVCPILAALWVSQLYSKFVAQRRPAAFFRSPAAQFVFALSIRLGRFFRVGDVSTLFSELALVRKPDDARTASRAKLYGSFAALRNGFGFEQAKIEITVDPRDGSTELREHFSVKAYASLGRLFQQDDELDGPVLECWLDVNHLDNVARSGPDFSNNNLNVRWGFALANPLKTGSLFDFVVRYKAGPPINGVKGRHFGAGAAGEFYYVHEKYPVAHLLVCVRPTDKNSFVLTDGHIIANVSDDEYINKRESARFNECVVGNEGGIDFSVRYPLMGGTYKFEWKISDKLEHGSAMLRSNVGNTPPLAALPPVREETPSAPQAEPPPDVPPTVP